MKPCPCCGYITHRKAPPEILGVWDRFAGIPMETFTKGWWYRACGGAPRQRTVAEMVEHRRALGSGGNCFDLALWLRHEFRRAGVGARIIGHHFCTPDAHAAVVATDRLGDEYLCDLGDMWLQPILISTPQADEWCTGFFPGREVRLAAAGDQLQVFYRRRNGKVANQTYDLESLGEDEWQQACHHSQNLLRRPFCEMLLPHPETGMVEHWEYDRGASFWNLSDGLVLEEPCASADEWLSRIAARTGLAAELIAAGFEAYRSPH